MKKLYITISGISIAIFTCFVYPTSLIGYFKNDSVSKVGFIKSHRIESGSLILRGKVSDITTTETGYIIGEQNKSSLLYLDKSLKPVERIGKQSDRKYGLKKVGPIDTCDNCVVLQDVGHSRILLLDNEGSFKKEFKSNLLSSQCFNIDYFRNGSVFFSIEDSNEPIVAVNLNSSLVTKYKRKVPRKLSSTQSRLGNKGYIKDYKNYFFYFPPTETFVEIFDENFESVNTVEFGHLDFLKNSKRRADSIYRTVDNQVLNYYNDVYQHDNKFYIIAFTDQPRASGNYKRSLYHVLEFTFMNDQLLFSRVIPLIKGKYYTQILVEDDRLFAYNVHDFLIDEYYIGN